MPYFHVRISHKNPQRRSSDTLALDKDEGWIQTQIVQPRAEGRRAFVSGTVVEWDDVDEIHITRTDRPSVELVPIIHERRRQSGVVSGIPDEWHVARDGQEVTEDFLSGPPGAVASEREAVTEAEDPSAVMVVHGQDEQAASALFDWLRAVGLRPREWNQLVRKTASGSPFIGDVLAQAFRETQAVVAFFTPDERIGLREELTGRAIRWRLQARPNVLFEAGMAFATHPTRTVLVVLGETDLPSDLAGRHYVRLGTVSALQDLAQRLETAGCPVDLTGDQWLNTERFPDRSEIAAEPELTRGAADPERSLAYRQVLAAHSALLQVYAGPRIYDSQIRTARTAFDDALSAVLVLGSPTAMEAAESLRQAWAPRSNGIHMGAAGWQDDVETARRVFLEAIRQDG